MTTAKTAAAPPRADQLLSPAVQLDAELAALPVAIPATWVCASNTPAWAWSIAASRLTRSSWSRIWLKARG